MQFTALFSLAMAAVAYAAPSTLEARQDPTTCDGETDAGTNIYTITARIPDADAPSICGGLWDNLNGWPCAASETSCGSSGGAFEWKFSAPLGCNQGMIESVWWEATKNQYSPIYCI